MMYQPGNAYNEQMINAAKKAGKNMFAGLDPVTRKARINEDVSSSLQSVVKFLRLGGTSSCYFWRQLDLLSVEAYDVGCGRRERYMAHSVIEMKLFDEQNPSRRTARSI